MTGEWFFFGVGFIVFISVLIFFVGRNVGKEIKDLKKTPQNKSFEDGPE
ncbi:hypothetical protein KKF60_00105 [Patescibacteria group bacterium]|nr:hypothetical protein [Patescibacteria group bacterium]MBU4458305.1 hypothetical protein [Patescibacteria group bacterium]MCG2695940.1 hypothetical protein [Candidatus Portnoybacteria bacterium]